jgi:aspartyl/asparaginyl beta-hydroxylase (cupin superfamily)
VVTNPDVSFVIDDVDHRLAAGRCYEFDNTRPHMVANRGATRRVHLICDVLPPADQRGA